MVEKHGSKLVILKKQIQSMIWGMMYLFVLSTCEYLLWASSLEYNHNWRYQLQPWLSRSRHFKKTGNYVDGLLPVWGEMKRKSYQRELQEVAFELSLGRGIGFESAVVEGFLAGGEVQRGLRIIEVNIISPKCTDLSNGISVGTRCPERSVCQKSFEIYLAVTLPRRK